MRALCDRRAGIGGDGVLRVVRADGPDAEWFMDYRNSDGSFSEMCGNGIRLFARYLVDEGLADGSQPIRVDTRDGVKVLTVDGDQITADMGSPKVLGETVVSVDRLELGATHVDIGNPHAVAFVAVARRRRAAARRRPATTRPSSRTGSTSSSSYAAATVMSRCACTSAARARPAPAGPAPAR